MLAHILKKIEQLQEHILNHDFVIVGEMHGSKQNAPFMQDLLNLIVNNGRNVAIAFEWSLTEFELSELRLYIQGGEIPKKLPEFFSNSDGRFTYEHAMLLKWIRNFNATHNDLISITVFDNYNFNEKHEEQMADTLTSFKKQYPGVVLVETGNMHARKDSYAYNNISVTPMAAILKNKFGILSIFLHYSSGRIDVEGIKRDVTQAASQTEGPKEYFDIDYIIPVSEPASTFIDFKEISEILI